MKSQNKYENHARHFRLHNETQSKHNLERKWHRFICNERAADLRDAGELAAEVTERRVFLRLHEFVELGLDLAAAHAQQNCRELNCSVSE